MIIVMKEAVGIILFILFWLVILVIFPLFFPKLAQLLFFLFEFVIYTAGALFIIGLIGFVISVVFDSLKNKD